jgi:hypothetical protein
MPDVFVLFGDFLAALPTYLLNGILASLYWLAGSGAPLVSLVCAGLLVRFCDTRLQSRAAYRPGRGGREAATPETYTAQVTTAIIAVLWVIAQWGMGAPVPWLGAAMWLVGTLLALVLHLQEQALLWNLKSGIAIYALAVIGSRLYLATTAQLSADQWAALIGSSQSAAAVIASTRGNVTTIILWALWLVIPLGYFAMLLQQVLINPPSLVNPLAGAGELIQRYRMRK